MIENLQKIVGENYVSNKKADLIAYSYDSSSIISEPSMVVWPGSPDEIRKIVLFCNRTNTPLVTRGLGTNTSGSTIADNSLVVDLTRLNKLYSVDFSRKEVDIEPGVILTSLNNYLITDGFEFPITPYFNKLSTIGGLASYNLLGPRSFKLGRMEKWINSVEYIDGTGKYYLIKDGLMRVVGKEGCSGIIIRLRLRIEALIKNTSADLLSFTNLPELFSKLNSLKKEHDVLSIDVLNKVSSAYFGLGFEDHLLVEYVSKRGGFHQERDVIRLIQRREKIYDVLRPKGFFFIEDVSGSIEQLFDVLTWAEKVDVPICGPIGLGVLFLMFQKEQEAYVSKLYSTAKEKAWSLGTVFGYGLQKKAFLPLELRREMMRLKEEYDYNNILNRGKMLDFR